MPGSQATLAEAAQNILGFNMTLPTAGRILSTRALSRTFVISGLKIQHTNRAAKWYRSYATHRDPIPTSSLLSHALDQKRRAAMREDSVGPFQLGLIPPTPQDGGNTKKWSELSAGGKGTSSMPPCNLFGFFD